LAGYLWDTLHIYDKICLYEVYKTKSNITIVNIFNKGKKAQIYHTVGLYKGHGVKLPAIWVFA
jgi:hypothetical protein